MNNISMSKYRDQLEAYLKTLDIKADRVLDVGGAALPVKNRVRSWDVKEYHIWDNGLEERDKSHIIDYGIDINVPWPDRRKGVHPYIKNYDIAFCLEVFEYVYNPILAVKNIYGILSTGGLLYITFPFIYPVHNPKENDYLRYTRNGAIKLLNVGGFKILNVIPRLMSPSGMTQWKQFTDCEGMHSARGVEHNELGVIIKAQKV